MAPKRSININLLPEEFTVSSGVSRALSITRMLGVIFLAVFLVFGLGLAAVFILDTVQLNNLTNENSAITSQISSMQSTETQLVLLKDRVGKIKIADNSASAIQSVSTFMPLVTSLSSSSKVNELDIDTSKIVSSLTFGSGADVSAFIKALGGTKFADIALTSFSFNPSVGYLVGINIQNKK